MIEMSYLLTTYLIPLTLLILLTTLVFFIINLVKRKWDVVLTFVVAYSLFIVFFAIYDEEYFAFMLAFLILFLTVGLLIPTITHSIKLRLVFKISLIIISLAFIFSVQYFDNFRNVRISAEGASLDEKQMLKDIKNIGDGRSKVDFVSVYPYIGDFKIDNKIIESNSHFLKVNLKDNKFSRKKENPSQSLVQSMAIWLYLQKRSLPYPIVAVRTFWSAWGNSQTSLELVTKDEFSDLMTDPSLNKTYTAQLPMKLAELWEKEYRETYEEISK